MSADFETKAVAYRPLTRAEVEEELKRLDLARLVTVARRYTNDLPIDEEDLLSEAACRTLTTRKCREGLTFNMFFSGVMRSIASGARKARDRRNDEFVHLPAVDASERMALVGLVVQSPEQELEIERERQLYADILDQLAAMGPMQAKLIDGIGLGMRGKMLASYLDITQGDLATLRRALKRNVQRMWPEKFEDRDPAIKTADDNRAKKFPSK
jgi:hypothetical protein